jgi:predicted transcriptional regulator of viral defense system
MKILEFINAFKEMPIFSTLDIEKTFPNFEMENLQNWQKKGYILRIRNKWYCFTNRIKILEELFFVANKIYQPSYVSLESALSLYSWIPETTFMITSITTLKTNEFLTPLGSFHYKNLKPDLFFGYKIKNLGGVGFKIAEPEKTLLDFLYFKKDLENRDKLMSYRLNLEEINSTLNWKRFEDYASLYTSNPMKKKINLLKTVLHG